MGMMKLICVAVLLASVAPSQSAEIVVKCILSCITPIGDIIYKFKAKQAGSTFTLTDSSQTVELVQSAKAVLKLVKSLRALQYGADNTARIKVELTQKKDNTILNVIKIEFVVLNERFADPLVSIDLLSKVSTLTKSTNIFRPTSAKYPLYKKIHSIVMKSTKRSKQSSQAQCNFRSAFKLLVKEVLLALKLDSKVTKVHAGPQGMLSAEKLQELIEATGCIPEIENVECGPETETYRTIDGTCNNEDQPTQGAAETVFFRLLPALYFDAEGLSEPAGATPDQPNAPDLPNPSLVTEEYITIERKTCLDNQDALTHMFMQWGQFLDHDMTLAPEGEAGEACAEIPCSGDALDLVDLCSPILPVQQFGRPCIRLIRSAARCPAKGKAIKPREQINVNTAYLDASMVYGSSEEVANSVRDLSNDYGLLKTSGANLLPIDNAQLGEPLSLCENLGSCFLAGDARVNEQAALAAMHTVWVREHNRIAMEFKEINPHWNGERVYQETRKILGAFVQQITYYEWLPLAIGERALSCYRGYKKNVDAGISNAFATAAFRLGHSLVRPKFDFLKKDYEPFPFSPVALQRVFFNNTNAQKFGIDGWMIGMIGNQSCEMDNGMAVGLTDNLFQRDNIDRVGLNLAALNMQRGREHGLPFYSDFLAKCQAKFPDLYPVDVSNVTSFDQIQTLFKPEVFESIKGVYNNDPRATDLWAAGIGEKEIEFRRSRQSRRCGRLCRRRFRVREGPILGPTFTCLLIDQFERLRDGDRFFFEKDKALDQDRRRNFKKLQAIRRVTLSGIICSNVEIVSIPLRAFVDGHKFSCANRSNRPINLEPWIEKVTSCSQEPCRNGGICRKIYYNKERIIKCFCKSGFTGEFCQNKI